MPTVTVPYTSDVNIRRGDDVLCGRLVALPTTPPTINTDTARRTWGYRNVISIDFPAMPDVIELARSAEYAVTPTLPAPDGIHVYKQTKPLEIPLSFRLHAMDEQYCKKGALTLLQLAARLHSFVLPISTFSPGTYLAPKAPTTTTPVNGGAPVISTTQETSQQTTVWRVEGTGNSNGGLFPPVTCWLHLMWVGEDQPGISAVGYVRDVRVRFNGPWMRGPNNSFNLPTWADYEFTFVHHPGHGNALHYIAGQSPEVREEMGQAYADDVRNKLYNTRDLVFSAASPGWKGFGTNPDNLTTEGGFVPQPPIPFAPSPQFPPFRPVVPPTDAPPVQLPPIKPNSPFIDIVPIS